MNHHQPACKYGATPPAPPPCNHSAPPLSQTLPSLSSSALGNNKLPFRSHHHPLPIPIMPNFTSNNWPNPNRSYLQPVVEESYPKTLLANSCHPLLTSLSSNGRDFLAHLEAHLTKHNGVDKLLKISLYASKIILAYSFLHQSHPLYPCLKSFESFVGVNCKAFHLDKFVQDLDTLQSTTRLNCDSRAILAYGGEVSTISLNSSCGRRKLESSMVGNQWRFRRLTLCPSWSSMSGVSC